MGRKVWIATAAACAACFAAPGAALGGTLDQQQPNGGGAALQVQSMQSVAQTFTAGLSGGLDQVDLKLSAAPVAPLLPLTVEIRNTAGGSPGTTVLASASVPAPAPPTTTFVPVAFTTPPPVAAGTQYAIVAYNADTGLRFWSWAVEASNPYTAGASFFQASSPPGSTWTEFTGSDLTFKTYVLTAAGTAATGQRAAALKKCKKKRSKAKRRKCRKKARKLPA
jgi:hypothetical protein